jgi:hypothetical protein
MQPGIWISGSANPNRDFVIASQGEMASFPAGTTPFFLEIKSARGVPTVQEIPHALDDEADQQHAHSLPFRYSVQPGQIWRKTAR